MDPCLPICPVLIPLFWKSNNLIYPVKSMCSRFCVVWFPAPPIQYGHFEWFLSCTGCYNQCMPLSLPSAMQNDIVALWLARAKLILCNIASGPANAMSHESCNTELAVHKDQERLACHLKWVLQIYYLMFGKSLVANHMNRWCMSPSPSVLHMNESRLPSMIKTHQLIV